METGWTGPPPSIAAPHPPLRCVVCGRLEGHCSRCHASHDRYADWIKQRPVNEWLVDPLRLRRVRRHIGWTQERVGRVLGVSKSSVSSWERGERVPDLTMQLEWRELLEAHL